MARIILAAPSDPSPDILAGRLKMQGYQVDVATDAADVAVRALAAPPAAVIADLWMPGISGVQLCRLLKAEPATDRVSVVLRGPENRRNRFWAERAGAVAYVTQGRIGDLVRALRRSVVDDAPDDEFFMMLGATEVDVRDRIASHLDEALFDSVIASEVRSLGTCEDFARLFDLFSQFVSQVISYRWLSIATAQPRRFGLHCHPAARAKAESEARLAMGLDSEAPVLEVEDEDAHDDAQGPPAIVEQIDFGGHMIGRVALAACDPPQPTDRSLVRVMARELAGPLRIVALLEESRRQATTDPLTGLLNRRAFLSLLDAELARTERLGYPLSLLLLDIDHFKQINDRRGHASGDIVLAALGALLKKQARGLDLVARWGGEEFVVALAGSDGPAAITAAERLRRAIEALAIPDAKGQAIEVTASIGAAERAAGESVDSWIDRADRGMYRAKTAGRNRVCLDTATTASTADATHA